MAFPRSPFLRPSRTYSAQNEDVTNRQQSKGCLELDAERRCKRLAHGKYSNTSAWPTAHEAHRQTVPPYGSCMVYIQRSTNTTRDTHLTLTYNLQQITPQSTQQSHRCHATQQDTSAPRLGHLVAPAYRTCLFLLVRRSARFRTSRQQASSRGAQGGRAHPFFRRWSRWTTSRYQQRALQLLWW